MRLSLRLDAHYRGALLFMVMGPIANSETLMIKFRNFFIPTDHLGHTIGLICFDKDTDTLYALHHHRNNKPNLYAAKVIHHSLFKPDNVNSSFPVSEMMTLIWPALKRSHWAKIRAYALQGNPVMQLLCQEFEKRKSHV